LKFHFTTLLQNYLDVFLCTSTCASVSKFLCLSFLQCFWVHSTEIISFIWNWDFSSEFQSVLCAVNGSLDGTKNHEVLNYWPDKFHIEEFFFRSTYSLFKFHEWYGIWRFNTLFTTAQDWICFWAKWVQSTFCHHITLRPIILLYFHVCHFLPSDFFLWHFQTKILIKVMEVVNSYILYFITLHLFPTHQ